MDCYTLLQFNQFIRQFVSLNVPEAVWITAEIGQLNVSKGHHYLELIQKDDQTDQLIARSQAALWAKTHSILKQKKKTNLDELLKEGIEIKLKARLDFHETFGLKLFIEDIDEQYTYGQMAIKKTEILNKLRKEKLLDLNKRLELKAPIKKIAVISSSTAAGYEDFMEHLTKNEYGYQFKVLLFSSAVQGMGIEQGFKDAFEDISIYDDFDCVIVIRGGGSKIDLAGFDNYEVCKAAANCKFPVLVGIGHEVDETILDLVAHNSLKTPTAVADYLLSLNAEFENKVYLLGLEIQKLAKELIAVNRLNLNNLALNIRSTSQFGIKNQRQSLSQLLENITYGAQQLLSNESRRINHLEESFTLLSIDNTLRRGFTITRSEKGFLDSVDKLEEGDLISTQFIDGTVESQVLKK